MLVAPSPVQPAAPAQSMLAPVELDANASPSEDSVSVRLSASHPPPRTSHDAVPLLSRLASAAGPVPDPFVDPLVVVVPRPEHCAVSQSTSTVALLLFSEPSVEPSASDSETVRHPPPETVQSAPAVVSDVGATVPVVASVVVSVVVSVVTVSAMRASWSASVELPADPVQPAPQSISASARTSPASSSSTELEVVQSPPWHRADPLPAPPVVAGFSRSTVSSSPALTSRASPVPSPVPPSRLFPELSLSHEPLALSHSADASSGAARERCSHSPLQRADAWVAAPSAPRLDALLQQPESSHDASASTPPTRTTPRTRTTDNPTHRSESRLPSADSLAAHTPRTPRPTHNPTADPSPSRSSSDTAPASRSVASISSSVAS